MLSSKERSKLRSIATNIETILQVGKGGISVNFLKQVSDALEAREIIKINVLNNSDESAEELVRSIAEQVGAEPVAAIGNKIILYKRSSKKDFKHLLD